LIQPDLFFKKSARNSTSSVLIWEKITILSSSTGSPVHTSIQKCMYTWVGCTACHLWFHVIRVRKWLHSDALWCTGNDVMPLMS